MQPVNALRRMSAAAAPSSRLFLGLDSSTQSLKVTAIDEKLNVVASFQTNFQKNLPRYGTTNGVHQKPGHVVTQPTVMYLEALDQVLGSMKAADFPFARVAAISGSGQQHGSTYWARGARDKLRGLAPGQPLHKQLKDAFAIPDSPIWMDSSTGAQCAALEKALGGPEAVARITGSRAYERFTGNQIAKIAASMPKEYANTERISLISSFMCSILSGDYAPIDHSDGCGMNLMELVSKQWSAAALAATAPALADKLGPSSPSHGAVGRISPYFTATYGIPADATCIAWSGDNPCSVAGLGLRAPGDVGISLGTSDTMFGITAAPSPGIEGHLFGNPVDPASYMAMVCYKNGSLMREKVRDATAGAGNWDKFNAWLLEDGAAGNAGHIGFYIDQPEITPNIPVTGIRRYARQADGSYVRVPSFAPAVEARAVVEGQFLSMRVHGESVGLTNVKRVIATGGASSNPAITQVLSDVFGAPVYAAAQTDSASLGAAFRALHGYRCAQAGKYVPFDVVLDAGDAGTGSKGLRLVASPRAAATAKYAAMLPAYRKLEAEVMAERA